MLELRTSIIFLCDEKRLTFLERSPLPHGYILAHVIFLRYCISYIAREFEQSPPAFAEVGLADSGAGVVRGVLVWIQQTVPGAVWGFEPGCEREKPRAKRVA